MSFTFQYVRCFRLVIVYIALFFELETSLTSFETKISRSLASWTNKIHCLFSAASPDFGKFKVNHPAWYEYKYPSSPLSDLQTDPKPVIPLPMGEGSQRPL